MAYSRLSPECLYQVTSGTWSPSWLPSMVGTTPSLSEIFFWSLIVADAWYQGMLCVSMGEAALYVLGDTVNHHARWLTEDIEEASNFDPANPVLDPAQWGGFQPSHEAGLDPRPSKHRLLIQWHAAFPGPQPQTPPASTRGRVEVGASPVTLDAERPLPYTEELCEFVFGFSSPS